MKGKEKTESEKYNRIIKKCKKNQKKIQKNQKKKTQKNQKKIQKNQKKNPEESEKNTEESEKNTEESKKSNSNRSLYIYNVMSGIIILVSDLTSWTISGYTVLFASCIHCMSLYI